MIGGEFKFENCLLKHYIRRYAWLPVCKERLEALKSTFRRQKDTRRLKYFTFCAVGALDVVMLNLEQVIKRSSSTKRFDSVVFFDVNQEFVSETEKTIPGAIGFSGDFVNVVLVNDPAEALITSDPIVDEAPTEEQNTAVTREMQRLRGMKRAFIQSFPFDVINLDLEEYLFKPKERLPGRVIRALRKVFEWQRLPGRRADGGVYNVGEFTLMFTTRLGPPNLDIEYLDMLRNYVEGNLARDEALKEIYIQQSGNREPADYLVRDFEGFFKLAVPKTIVSLLLEEDWEIDLRSGLQIFEFERKPVGDPYWMLHFVMSVRRIRPAQEERAPGQMPSAAAENYRQVVRKIFETKAADVSNLLAEIGEDPVRSHLNRVKAHRAKTSRGSRG
jgi:hypothetical protein